MSGLKELKNRITSVRATQKITRAMQMVAASKLRRAQENMMAARPYAATVEKVLHDVAANLPESGNDVPLFTGNGKQQRHLILVLSAQRGLCGSFNTNIARRARNEADALIRDGKQVLMLCAGRKAAEQLAALGRFDLVHTWHLPSRGDLVGVASEIATDVTNRFSNDEFDVCKVIFAKYINVLTQRVQVKTLVPWLGASENDSDADFANAQPSEDDTSADSKVATAAIDLEPGSSEVLESLLERNLVSQIARGLLENAASEQGARMTAMDSATRNAGEMIDKLTLTFNRTRQAIITKELIEIISGAEAV